MESIITNLISDLQDELKHLEKYSSYPQIDINKVIPLWWTHRYDGIYLAGFCSLKDKLLRFQIVYQQDDIKVYILQEPSEHQLEVEQERKADWEQMVGLQKTFIGKPNAWEVRDNKPCSGAKIDPYYAKHFTSNGASFKEELDYSNNNIIGVFYIESV